jgi:hypothetical protein
MPAYFRDLAAGRIYKKNGGFRSTVVINHAVTPNFRAPGNFLIKTDNLTIIWYLYL